MFSLKGRPPISVERYRQFWELSFDRPEDHLRELQKKDKRK